MMDVERYKSILMESTRLRWDWSSARRRDTWTGWRELKKDSLQCIVSDMDLPSVENGILITGQQPQSPPPTLTPSLSLTSVSRWSPNHQTCFTEANRSFFSLPTGLARPRSSSWKVSFGQDLHVPKPWSVIVSNHEDSLKRSRLYSTVPNHIPRSTKL